MLLRPPRPGAPLLLAPSSSSLFRHLEEQLPDAARLEKYSSADMNQLGLVKNDSRLTNLT